MKIFLFFTLSVFLGFSVYANDAFNGKWTGEDRDNSGTVISTLSLKLTQHENKILGQYCYISQQGNYIDCPADSTMNLYGKVTNPTSAIITFSTSQGNEKHLARLEINNDKMRWQLHEQSSSQSSTGVPLTFSLVKDDDSHTGGESKKLETPKFSITITNRCGELLTPCDNVFYIGVRKKDNEVITLTGKTLTDEVTKKVNGAKFINGNVEYIVNFEAASLQVIQNDHILMDEKGTWNK